jgi:hypothetical protein
MASELPTQRIPDGRLLTGHVAEWGELLGVLLERRGLTVIVADPLSGTSALLAAALTEYAQPHVLVDARRCADALDLAMAIADGAVAALAPEASAWWSGTAPPRSTAGLRVWRSLTERGVDVDDLRHGGGRSSQRLGEALDLTAVLATGPVILAIDHLGTCSPTSAPHRLARSSASCAPRASAPATWTSCSSTIRAARSTRRSAMPGTL